MVGIKVARHLQLTMYLPNQVHIYSVEIAIGVDPSGFQVRKLVNKVSSLQFSSMALNQLSVWKRGFGDKVTKTYKTFVSQTDMIVVTERWALYAQGNLVTKFCLYRTFINNVCYHGYRSTIATNVSRTSILIIPSLINLIAVIMVELFTIISWKCLPLYPRTSFSNMNQETWIRTIHFAAFTPY